MRSMSTRSLIYANSHVPESANKERQADSETTGCAYADEVLLTALRGAGRFVDQEAFGADRQ